MSMNPKHGDERNRHQWRSTETERFAIADTGELVRLPVVGRSGARAERYCATCGAWKAVGAGLNGGLIGFIICPDCKTDWNG